MMMGAYALRGNWEDNTYMNKQRKTEIKAEIDGLRALRKAMRAEPRTPEALAKELEVYQKRITAIHDKEQDEFDKMSEKQQCSTAGEIAEESIALLEDAMDYMDELVMDVKDSEELDLSEIGYSMEDVIDLLSDIINM